MDTCAVETGLLSKKPCGQPAATRCANCEMALCSKHALPRLVDGKKTGKFLCKECDAAKKAIDHTDALAKKKAEVAAVMRGGPAPKPAAAPAAAPKPKEPAKPQPKHDDGGALEFTPSKKPEEKK